MENMLITLVQPMMQVQYTKGGQLCCQDYIVNFPQDVSSIVAHPPCLPEEIKAVIIWQDNADMSHHINFVVHHEKVQCTLEYKIAHDLDYAEMYVSNNTLLQLPENGTVLDHISTYQPGQQNGGDIPEVAGPMEVTSAEEPLLSEQDGELDL